MVSGAIAPASLATTVTGAGPAPAPPRSSAAAVAPHPSSPAPAPQVSANEADVLPQPWSPRSAELIEGAGVRSAAALFDGDGTTAIESTPGTKVSVRIVLGSERKVVGLGISGTGRASVAVHFDDSAGRRVASLADQSLTLSPGTWSSLAPPRSVETSTLVIEWTAGPQPARLAEVMLWVLGKSGDALSEAGVADRLILGLPENASETRAQPESGSIARIARGGAQGATFSLRIDRDPELLGRTFLVYELERLAHWTAPMRAINGQALRGGYRANVRGTGGVQVEEIATSWLRRGDNSVAFQPSQTEDGLGYVVKHVRLVGVPRGGPGVPRQTRAGAKPQPLDDGSDATGLGGPGVHASVIPIPNGEPAHFAFFLDRPGKGEITVSTRATEGHRRGQVQIDLAGRAAGWQAVDLHGVLPAAPEMRIAVTGDREGLARVTEARVLSYPVLADGAEVAVSYPLHGECVDHQTYLRGFVRSGSVGRGARLALNNQERPGALDADGSFAAVLREPASARGKPWTAKIEVVDPRGARATRVVPVEACVDPPRPRIVGAAPPIEDVGAPYGAVVSPHTARTLSFGGATIEVPAGAVTSDVRVTIRPLAEEKLAPLGPLMTNVMPSGGAYRFGPHGLVFKKPVKVTLPVDASRVPSGMSAADVQTYFYDEAHGKWITIGHRSTTRERVVAMSGHFTDFISATMTMPDHPDAQLFNPNSVKGVSAGDPGAGITLIEPPQPDSTGSARLRYPIETPPGRNGIQPDLGLGYDSERVNVSGWLGVGWDLGMSSIEIDTRFGVPRYDGTESYLLDGAMLVQNSDGTFRHRVEGRFDHIERKGSDPTSYFWEITDRKGTKFTYGAGSGRLADPRGGSQPANIFRWSLERVEDTFGNFMAVTYYPPDSFVNGDTFTQVYPKQIDYTGAPGFAAPYRVLFKLDDGSTRPDVTITGRPGFPVATRRRLVQIDVTLGATPVRTYAFHYDDANLANSFNKSLLSAVSLRSDPLNTATELYRHTFEYNKAPPLDGMFARESPFGDLTKGGNPPPLRDDDGLSHAQDVLYGASGSVGFGLGDFFSATVSAGGDSGDSTPNLLFVDANGDGMPDQIESGGHVSLNSIFGRGQQGLEHFGSATFPGLGGVGHTNRSGWTVGGSISALEGVFGAGGSYAQHSAEDDALVTDMDGDGFPDVVSLQDGTILVNRNTGAQAFGNTTQWNNYSLGGVAFTRQDRFGQAKQANAFFATDPLIRWVAPFAGTVKIDSTLMKVRAGGDGVRADLFINAETSPRWTCTFSASAAGSPCTQSVTTAVAAGDRVYLKVDPLDEPLFDELTSSHTIAYQVDSSVAGQLEPYGAPIYAFDRKQDFSLAGKPYLTWTASASGDLQVNGCFDKDPTADNITASVTRDGPGGFQRFSLDLLAEQTGTFCIPGLDQPIAVQVDDSTNTQDILTFAVASETQINPATVRWPAKVAYQSYCRKDPQDGHLVCGAPVCLAQLCTIGPGDPLADFPIPQGLTAANTDVFYPAFQWTSATPAPTRTIVTESASPEITWTVSSGGIVGGRFVPGPRMFVFVQGVNRLISKAHLDSTNRTVSIDTSPNVGAGQQLFFTVFFPDGAPQPGQPFSIGTPRVDGIAAQANVRFPDPRLDNNGTALVDPMSGGYHRWFYGDWNGSLAFDETRIVPRSNPQHTDPFVPATPAPYGLVTRPDLGVTPLWLGRGAGELMAAGIINPGFTTSGAGTGRADAVSALRVSDTWNVDLSATAAVINANLNAGDSTTDIDLFDVNGDRLPDSVTHGQVQFNQGFDPLTGQGSFGSRTPMPMVFEDVRSTTNGAFRLGFGAVGVGHMINLANSKSDTAKHVDTDVASASTDYGMSSTRTDFMDINGDGLPDHVRREPGDSGGIHVALNLGYAFSKEIVWNSPAWQQGEIAPDLSVFGSSIGSELTSDVVSTALDALDATGLIPDHPPLKIKSSNVLRLTDSQTNNLSVGTPGQTFGAGGGPNASLTRRLVDFVDLNGDGLLDQVMRVPGQNSSDGLTTFFHVKLNQGDHFGPEAVWSIPNWQTDISLPAFESLPHPDGIGYSTMAGWGVSIHFQVCYFICVGGSAFYSRSNGGANVEFEDVDGDGKPDHVLKRVDDPTVHVKLNKTDKTNLLAKIHRPLGGTIAIDYKRIGNHVDHTASPQIDMPSNQWALASVTVESGQPASQPQPLRQTFDYTSPGGFVVGVYDRSERENYGYADVKTVFPDEGSSLAVSYNNRNYYERGLPTSTTWNQVDSPAQTLKRQVTTYADPSGKDPTNQPVRIGTFFPAPRDSETIVSEGDPGGRTKRHLETKTYDSAGNLTDVVDFGDVDLGDPTDDFNYHVDYVHPDAAGLITQARVVTARTGQTQAGALLRQKTATYSSRGKPLTVTSTVVGGKDPSSGLPRTETSPALATWTFTYDAFGNVETATGPEGHAFAYEYEPTTRTHRSKTTDNSFGYVSTADYDLRFGQPKAVVDINGAKQHTDHDDFGRLVAVFGPKDFDSNGVRTTPSVTVDYSEQPHAASFTEVLPANATTSHKNVLPPEMSRPGDAIPSRLPIRTVAFADGLERIIQTKNDVTFDDGAGNVVDGMTVSGAVTFDSRGRMLQQGQPVFRAGRTTNFVGDIPMINPATFAYDMLARERQVTRPDSSSTDAATHGNLSVKTTSYQLGTLDGRVQLVKIIQDPRGEVRNIYRSVREVVLAVDEVNRVDGVDNVHLITRYGYDPISQLVTVTDAKENVTTAVYDTTGNMVALTNPDAGRTEWRYDRSGNAVVKETPNLRAANQLISYVYNKDRLEAILYPTTADVQYVYGDATETGPAKGFVAGRVKRRVDESGQVDFRYDELGNVVSETSALISLLPSQKNGYLATTSYSYDTFGRMIEMKFPGVSAEVLRYGYDAGGAVTSARGVTTLKEPNKDPDIIYLRHIGYDEFGQRSRTVMGNGIATRYAYEPDTRRLSEVNGDYRDPWQVVHKVGPFPMQRLRYQYDVASNVRSLQNAVPVQGENGPVIVGPTSYTYDYDRLYQLTHVDGLYQNKANTRFRHSLDYVYDGIGNILQKNQQDFQDQTGPNGVFQTGQQVQATTYRLDYQYGGSAPHAATHIDELLHQNLSTPRDVQHDRDGNQTGWIFSNGTQRVQTWTEEDRLRQVADQGHMIGQYLYNGDGVRTHAFSNGRELVYINQYVTLRNNGPNFTKHIYAGNTRIATRVDGNSAPASTTLWYHPDHMQSTQFISTDDQSLVEHVEYFASGETWKDEGSSTLETSRPQYLFNGKELDVATGYYYFGARYYDPVVQNWQAVDPALPGHIRGGAGAGVFKPANLGVYTYTWNNPVVLRDPDGRDVMIYVGIDNKDPAFDVVFDRQATTLKNDLVKKYGFKASAVHIVHLMTGKQRSEMKEAKKSMRASGRAVSGSVFLGHGNEGSVAVGPGDPDNPAAGRTLSDDISKFKGATDVASNGVFVPISCDGGLGDKGAREADKILFEMDNQVYMSGFNDDIQNEYRTGKGGEIRGTGRIKSGGKSLSPADLVPDSSNAPGGIGQTVGKILRSTETRVNKSRAAVKDPR